MEIGRLRFKQGSKRAEVWLYVDMVGDISAYITAYVEFPLMVPQFKDQTYRPATIPKKAYIHQIQ